jgi:hypothetical protein
VTRSFAPVTTLDEDVSISRLDGELTWDVLFRFGRVSIEAGGSGAMVGGTGYRIVRTNRLQSLRSNPLSRSSSNLSWTQSLGLVSSQGLQLVDPEKGVISHRSKSARSSLKDCCSRKNRLRSADGHLDACTIPLS